MKEARSTPGAAAAEWANISDEYEVAEDDIRGEFEGRAQLVYERLGDAVDMSTNMKLERALLGAALHPNSVSVATALADVLDETGEWDWTDDAETDPSDRFAVCRLFNVCHLVYRGTEPDSVATYETARQALAALAEATE